MLRQVELVMSKAVDMVSDVGGKRCDGLRVEFAALLRELLQFLSCDNVVTTLFVWTSLPRPLSVHGRAGVQPPVLTCV